MKILNENDIIEQWEILLDNIQNEPIAIQRDGEIISFMFGIEFLKDTSKLLKITETVDLIKCECSNHTLNEKTAQFLNLPDGQQGWEKAEDLKDFLNHLDD